MAKIQGQESKFLHQERVRGIIVFTVFFLITLAVFIIASVFNVFHLSEIITWAVVALMLAGFVIFRVIARHLAHHVFNYNSGIRGERAIAGELKKLPDDYTVFQDIILPGIRGNIDFIVITAKTHIFTIEVKNHHGNIEFNGQKLTINGQPFEKDILNQAMHEATGLHDCFMQSTGQDIFVTPVLAFAHPRAHMRFGLKKIQNVHVIQKRFLKKLLTLPLPENDTNQDEITKLLKATTHSKY